jgi:hypothetical protein
MTNDELSGLVFLIACAISIALFVALVALIAFVAWGLW